MTPRVVIVGAGQHGRRIAQTYLDQGGSVIGTADPARVGEALSDVIAHAKAADIAVVKDAADLIALGPDIALITAPVDLTTLGTMAGTFLDAGIDVITIHPDAFDPPSDWAGQIDARARAGGARFLSTGVQDVWWVHVPATAAGATSALRRVIVHHATDLDTLSPDLGRLFAVGEPIDRFHVVAEIVLAEAPVLGGPLRVLARRLGLTPGMPTRNVEPVTSDTVVNWRTGGIAVPPGRLLGFVETVEIATGEGVTLTGVLRTALLAEGEQPVDRVTLDGDPVLHLEHRPFPGSRITDIVPCSRIWTLRDAAPGLHTAASLPPAAYHHH